jgi:probable phosphoglycerate mutase
MKSTTLFLIRHGETDWNVSKRVQGHCDIPLNKKGTDQARLLGDELKDTTFHAIYASPLLRAYQTALHLASEDRIITDARLKETCYGIYEGLQWSEFYTRVGRHLEQYQQLPVKQKLLFKFDNSAESYFEVYTRAKACLDEIVLKHPGEQIAVVAHGGLIKSLLSTLQDIEPRKIEIDNTGYVVMKADKTQYAPIRYCRIREFL